MSISYRKFGYEGIEKLMWVTTDIGAFQLPLHDWLKDKKYFLEKVKKFDVVIQAGGNCGMYARLYGNYFNHVYSFEPDPLNYACLETNCQGDKYTLFQGGLGNTKDSLTLKRRHPQNVGEHRIENTPGDIKMYRIDDLDLKHCDLIHLDVEDYEPEVIKGAVETINKFSPVVITENGTGGEELIKLGYTKYRQLTMDTVFIKM